MAEAEIYLRLIEAEAWPRPRSDLTSAMPRFGLISGLASAWPRLNSASPIPYLINRLAVGRVLTAFGLTAYNILNVMGSG